jgi:hypothetical protein
MLCWLEDREGIGSKGLCDIPYKKKSKNPSNGLFFTFCMGDCKYPRDICRIATTASPLLLNLPQVIELPLTK